MCMCVCVHRPQQCQPLSADAVFLHPACRHTIPHADTVFIRHAHIHSAVLLTLAHTHTHTHTLMLALAHAPTPALPASCTAAEPCFPTRPCPRPCHHPRLHGPPLYCCPLRASLLRAHSLLLLLLLLLLVRLQRREGQRRVGLRGRRGRPPVCVCVCKCWEKVH